MSEPSNGRIRDAILVAAGAVAGAFLVHQRILGPVQEEQRAFAYILDIAVGAGVGALFGWLFLD